MLFTKLKAAIAVVLILGVVVTGTTIFTCRTAAGQDDKKPAAEKPVEPTAKSKQEKGLPPANKSESVEPFGIRGLGKSDLVEEAKEAFTAWGKEVGGLQAGLGYKPGEKRVYSHGETVTLVVRVRNVGKETVKIAYYQPGIDRTVLVTDGDGKAIPQPVVIPGDLEYVRKVAELPPGKEIDLHELKRQLRPATEGASKIIAKQPPYALYGTGKVQVQFDKLVPKSTDRILGNIVTGKLEPDVKDAEK